MTGKKVMKLRAQAKKFAFKFEGVAAPKGAVGKYYPADDAVPKKGPTPVRNPPKLRKNISAGTVLILLAGRFRGKRVVFLKQLSSGLLLVTGPYTLNGVPLKRVNQKYAIATKTTVDVSGINVSAIDDALFAREKVQKKDKLTDLSAEPVKKTVSPQRQELQTKIDAELTARISKVQLLDAYLKAKFSLSKADKPHAMVF